ncbi:penicillin-binding protein 1C [Paragemmobacter straminiformis]|uniref:peptidoglycan glycosyltransferase n=1 Tax=Paragemmobacter straminiformis TaxID=2045119 RepID=A0A842IA28_9RHOB|nr:penicillin-binding protein 1C [Gemmobacter straminiformis]MBC2836263.1 penicillin-binding protein 1C [Gemmobacter straminiformis]
MKARHVLALAAGLFLAALDRDGADRWIDATALPPLSPETSVQVLDRHDQLLRAYTVADGRWRLALGPQETDPTFIAMLLAFEDRRFYTHHGVDPRALLRAALQAAWNGRVVSGGSTLTMQVARLLEEGTTGKVAGKLRQIRLALALERRLTKSQILALYLQLAPYGGNVEGLRAAAITWFGKEPARLTPAQSALLIALPQSPERRRPDRFPNAARAARDRILARAVAAGVLSRAEASAATRESIPAARLPFPALAPHMADRALAADAGKTVHHLCIDASLQKATEILAADTLRSMGDRVQTAIVVADYQTGEILASVGSAAFRADNRQGFVDMTTALRSPGSTLKPMVYALAFDAGLAHPETLIDDTPTRFGTYAPQNFDRQFHGTIRLREALQLSLNIPVVKLLDALGPERLLAALDESAVHYRLPAGKAGLAIGLGGIGVTLEDMVTLYAGLANGGQARPLRWRSDDPLTKGKQVISPIAAWQVTDILTGLAPPPGAPANRLAYKTGTSYGHRDAWAIGYDGRHVIGVWLGRPDGTPVPGAFGADLAAPVLFQAFARLKPSLTPQPPAPPATLLLANAQLPQPLQRFRPRDAAFAAPADSPRLAFPPDGAEVEPLASGLMVRVEGGSAPFTWLADGRPVATAERGRETVLPLTSKGFLTLSVIDSAGRSARATIRLR